MSLTLHPKIAHPHYDIDTNFRARWSPYSFSPKAVPLSDLRACFEAARWAPSSYNEQPWRYLVATSSRADEFARILRCLLDANQSWAKRAPVLALGLFKKSFSNRDRDNKAAPHDLGAASAFLTMEATRRGLYVHQMIGIDPDAVRREYHLCEDIVPFTGLAIGYPGLPDDSPQLSEEYSRRDQQPRERRTQEYFVFGEDFGSLADI